MGINYCIGFVLNYIRQNIDDKIGFIGWVMGSLGSMLSLLLVPNLWLMTIVFAITAFVFREKTMSRWWKNLKQRSYK